MLNYIFEHLNASERAIRQQRATNRAIKFFVVAMVVNVAVTNMHLQVQQNKIRELTAEVKTLKAEKGEC